MRRNSWGQFVSARRNPKSAVPWRKVGQGSWQAKTAKGTIGVTFSYASGGYYGSTPSEDGPILKTRLAASRWAENAVGVSRSVRKNSYSTSGSSTKRRNGARSMADIKAANTAAGHHWFSKATMAFFNSRVVAGPFEGDTFVTSEQGPHQNRPLFSVRRAEPDGRIETVGEFQGYSSKAAAVAAAKGLRKNGRLR